MDIMRDGLFVTFTMHVQPEQIEEVAKAIRLIRGVVSVQQLHARLLICPSCRGYLNDVLADGGKVFEEGKP